MFDLWRRFVYTNLGADNVQIEWAFTNAETGELVCGNFGKPANVMAGKGAIWDYLHHVRVSALTAAAASLLVARCTPCVPRD